MSSPFFTYELKISFTGDNDTALATKELVMAWLNAVGIDTFVEGAIDGLDIDHDYAQPPQHDPFFEMGGATTPLSIFKYEQEFLVDLQAKLHHDFQSAIESELTSIETTVWQEGWKESFTPIYTRRFTVYPPWETIKSDDSRLPICIEPGMAFGTGQHATTVLCLELLEDIWEQLPSSVSVADIGCGTGVLAIAAAKLGADSVLATDIDHDAIKASKENAQRNNVTLTVELGSVPKSPTQGFPVVVANILAVVLEKILPEMSAVVAPDGFLIMSGILSEQVDAIERQAVGLGLRKHLSREQAGWVALCFTKVD